MSASVLFDAPGPKARRRHTILTVIGVVVALFLAYLAVRKMREANQLEADMWKPFVTDGELWREYLVQGLIGTFQAAAISIVLAGVFGLLFGIGRLSAITPVRWICGVVVEFFRAVPVLLMMIFLYFGIYSRTDIFSSETAPLAAVVTALTLYNGSVIAELVRSGVFSLPKGQSEAGLSIGLTRQQTLRSIQLPQALTAMLPALIGQFVVILKDSALGFQITYPELLNQAKTLGSAYANTVPAYIVAAVLFILVNFALTVVASKVEKRLSKRGRTTLHATGPVDVAPEQVSTLGGGGVQNIDPTNTAR